MDLNTHIFRQYDIRGIVGEDLTPELAEAVGRAYGSELIETTGKTSPTIVVGRDNRPSSPSLAAGLIAGLMKAGVDVQDLGTVPTPVVYWAERVRGTDGGIQITGSHNPPEYNGIKMTMQGASFFGDSIQGLLERIESGRLAEGDGAQVQVSVLDDYVHDVVGRFELARPLKVVVDCGNGVGALVAVRLLEMLGAEVIPLYCESDGTFPNHHPDPTVDEYIVDLIQTVKDTGAELGIGFDGDADRIGAVDENGQIVRGDLLLLVFGLDLLATRGPGQKLLFDVKCSQVLPEVFEQAGGEPIMGRTGHSFMKQKMMEIQAPIAGELSGHICFADSYYGFDDALYGACRLIDLLARDERTLSEIISEFPRYVSTPELRIDVSEDLKFGIVDDALAHFRERHDVLDVDGVRILFGDGWGLLRASNTQPVIVARYEARTEERLLEIREYVESWLRDRGVDA